MKIFTITIKDKKTGLDVSRDYDLETLIENGNAGDILSDMIETIFNAEPIFKKHV